MKKLFLLVALATSISSQSFAIFEKDAEGDYLLWSEDGQPTELLSRIAGKCTQIEDINAEDGHPYVITVQITPTDLNWLSDAYDAEDGILYVLKGNKIVANDIAALQEYEIATSFSDQAIALALSSRRVIKQ